MDYTPVSFVPSIILSSPTLLLTLTSTGFKVPYSHMCRKYLSHIPPPFPSSFALPSPVPSPQHDLLYTPVLRC